MPVVGEHTLFCGPDRAAEGSRVSDLVDSQERGWRVLLGGTYCITPRVAMWELKKPEETARKGLERVEVGRSQRKGETRFSSSEGAGEWTGKKPERCRTPWLTLLPFVSVLLAHAKSLHQA